MTVKIDFSDDEDPLVPTSPQPPDKVVPCAICKQPLRVRHHWVFNRWMHGTVHDRCADQLSSGTSAKTEEPKIPERFSQWDPERFPHKRALSEAQSFDPDSRLKGLIIIGPSGSGKSRLMWNIVAQFFDIWQTERRDRRWVEYFLFSDLMTQYDQAPILKLKNCQFAFVDDLGCTDSFGRSRASSQLQDAIRYRLSNQRWTFITMDDKSFDSDLIDNVVRDRAKLVIIDE